MSSKSDRLAALKQARERGGRLQQWQVSIYPCVPPRVSRIGPDDDQPEEADVYDEVTDEQYKSIVGSRLDETDFIEDDDGSGYVYQGTDDWDGAEEREEEEESDDEDDFEGEDEELRQGLSSHFKKANEFVGTDNCSS